MRISSISSILPSLPGIGPRCTRASSSSAASAVVQRTSSRSSERGRYNASTSSSSRCFCPEDFKSAREPKRSCNNCAGVNTGHIRSNATRMSSSRRSASRTSRCDTSPSRQVAANADHTSPSTHLRPELCRRKRRRAVLIMRSVSSARKRTYPLRKGNTMSSRSGRCRSRTAFSITSDMRSSPLTRAVSGRSCSPALIVTQRTSGTRSCKMTCSIPASPSDGKTRSIYRKNTRFGPITKTP